MSDVPQLIRHWNLLRSLGARRMGATLRELANDAGVSQKTILRDLDLLRTLGFPLTDEIGHRGRKQWKLDNAAGLPQLNFTLEEAAALYLGRQFLEPLAGTYFFQGAQSAFQKIRATFGDAALRHLEKLAAAFYHKSHGLADYAEKGQLIDDLARAIEDRRLTVITYQSLRATEPVTHYDVHPYGLVWHKHALYLIAYSCDHAARRTFKVDRITVADVQGLQFTRPADFDLADFLIGSFGIFHSDGPPLRVVVRFSSTVARLLQEKSFHPSQQLTSQPDGSLLAEYSLTTFEEFTSWLLSFGPQAEVLEPPSLRDTIAGSLQKALLQYRSNQSLPRVEEAPAGKAKAKQRVRTS